MSSPDPDSMVPEDTFHRLVAMDEYLSAEMDLPWTDGDVQRVRDSICNRYKGDADSVYGMVINKLMSPKTHVFARMNLLFLLDKFCIDNFTATDRPFHTLYSSVAKDLVRICNWVLDIGDAEPPNRPANANIAWMRKVLAGWRRRGMFDGDTLARVDSRICASEALAEIPFEDGPKYDDEKIDRRMDADRDRQKQEREDWFARRISDSWEELPDTWFLSSSINYEDLRIHEFWLASPDELTSEDLECISRENEKYRISCIERVHMHSLDKDKLAFSPTYPAQVASPANGLQYPSPAYYGTSSLPDHAHSESRSHKILPAIGRHSSKSSSAKYGSRSHTPTGTGRTPLVSAGETGYSRKGQWG
ncbi:hypothetical protein BC832DRAFT_593985 [Gaertneriomyces semiglobifer]|nr:hypothetical protein BC832DRAFT_593985 [Gaertneriomyces semiglobifer]